MQDSILEQMHAKDRLAHGLSSHECSKPSLMKDMHTHPHAPQVPAYSKTPTVKESLDMAAVNELEDTKLDRMRQFLQLRDRRKLFDFKNPRHNTASFGRNEAIRKKYNLQRKR